MCANNYITISLTFCSLIHFCITPTEVYDVCDFVISEYIRTVSREGTSLLLHNMSVVSKNWKTEISISQPLDILHIFLVSLTSAIFLTDHHDRLLRFIF
jgi:hypothetical protein